LKTDPANVSALIIELEDALVIDDREKVAESLKKLALLGHSQSYADIANLYEFGSEKIAPRLDLAFEWYRKSAYEEIDSNGYLGLGRFYFYGKHVSKDVAQALKFFKDAFDMGSMEAGVMLGYSYFNGFGGIKNIIKAKEYLSQVAEHGYVIAFYFLYKIALKQGKYIQALKLWWTCISQTRRLTISDPNSPKLYFVHGAWKI
jgi:TPR repeat protein